MALQPHISNTIVLLVCCLFMNFVSGSLYAFPLYADQVKERLGLSQFKVIFLGAFLFFLGCVCSYPFSALGRTKRGFYLACVLMALCMFLGYLIPAVIMDGKTSMSATSTATFVLALVGFGLVGVGIIGMSILGMGKVMNLFPTRVSAAMAFMQLFYGIGAATWPWLYTHAMDSDAVKLFYVLSATTAISFLVFTLVYYFFAVDPSEVAAAANNERAHLLGGDANAGSLQEKEVETNSENLSYFQLVGKSLRSRTMLLVFFIFINTYGASVNTVNNGEFMLQAVPPSSSSSSSAARGGNGVTVGLASSSSFPSSFPSSSSPSSWVTDYIHPSNTSTTVAPDASTCSSDNLIVFSGLAQTCGRVVIVLVNYLYDRHTHSPHHINANGRPSFSIFHPIVWAGVGCVFLFVMSVVAASVDATCMLVRIYVFTASLCYAFSWSLFYGAMYSVAPVELTNPKYTLETMGVATMISPALGPALFTVLFGVVYDSYGYEVSDGSINCVGASCFRASFAVCAACTAVALVACVVVYNLAQRLRQQEHQAVARSAGRA